jgi:hypothetical protein
LQIALENQTRTSNIKASLVLAYERADFEPKNIDQTTKDISGEFYFLEDEEIQKALRNGGLGMYGIPYKLSTLVFCAWIREYLRIKNINKYVI